MPESVLGGQGTTLLTAIIIVAVALLAMVVVFWLMRARATSTFIRGGRNRQPRLAVLDAAAVDTRRRLVLIRRDDVEHLIMIGGPSDLVIESRIVAAPDEQPAPPPRARPVAEQAPHSQPVPASADQPARAAPPARAPQPAAAHRPAEQPLAPPQPPMRPPAPAPARPAAATPATAAASVGTAAAAASELGSIRAEAADVLETSRARVFEEPSFDADDFDELAAAPEKPASPDQPGSRSSVSEPGLGKPSSPAEIPDFESVLAQELSGDLALDWRDEGLDDLDQPVSAPPVEAETTQAAPDVKPETPPSRDSLEAEMERLLGDLSRRP